MPRIRSPKTRARIVVERLAEEYPGSARDLCALAHDNPFQLLVAKRLTGGVLRFGHAVAISQEDFAGMHLDRAFIVSHIVEQAHDSSPGLQPAYRAIFPDQDRRQMPAIAISQVVRASVVDSQEKSGVLFRRSAFVELVVEQAEQGSGRNLDLASLHWALAGRIRLVA